MQPVSKKQMILGSTFCCAFPFTPAETIHTVRCHLLDEPLLQGYVSFTLQQTQNQKRHTKPVSRGTPTLSHCYFCSVPFEPFWASFNLLPQMSPSLHGTHSRSDTLGTGAPFAPFATPFVVHRNGGHHDCVSFYRLHPMKLTTDTEHPN